MHDRSFWAPHPSRDETARRMGQRLFAVNDHDDAMLRHCTTAHLASPVCAVDNLCPKLVANLAFVGYVFPLGDVLVEDDVPLLSIDDHAPGFFPDYEPFLQITLAAIKMSLVLWP
jgi:hypothetical protein